MKTFSKIKPILTFLALAFCFQASAGVNSIGDIELKKVTQVGDAAELTFVRKVGSRQSTIKAIDDDGMLTLAAVHFNMMQNFSEAIREIADVDGPYAANERWNRVRDLPLSRYSNIRPTVLKSLERLTLYTNQEIRKLEAQLEAAGKAGNRAAYSQIIDKLVAARGENTKAKDLYSDFATKDEMTPKELSEGLGDFLLQNLRNHKYATRIGNENEKLLDAFSANLKEKPIDPDTNPIGYMLSTRPLLMGNFVFVMPKNRGKIDFAANVLTDLSAIRTLEGLNDSEVIEGVDHTATRLNSADRLLESEIDFGERN
ncbi:MAG: hypothetical protein R3A80_03240 [Bdellovibrionota bacterium]